MKKYLAILLSVLLVVSVCSISVAAEQGNKVSVRIEGVDENLYYGDYTLNDDENVLDILEAIDNAEDSLSVTIDGGDYGDYVSAINGVSAATFGGWDGWQYYVNGWSPDVGMGGYKPVAGDEIVIYYGDYPCPLPEINLEKIGSGEICFSSTSTDWVDDGNGNYNPVTSVLPINDAQVTLGDKTFTTDKDGKITFDRGEFGSSASLQINKKNPLGAPAICRLAPDYVVEFDTASPDEAATTESVETTAVEDATDAVETTAVEETTEAVETTAVEETTEAVETTAAEATTEAVETTAVEATTEAVETTAAEATTEAVETTTPDTTASNSTAGTSATVTTKSTQAPAKKTVAPAKKATLKKNTAEIKLSKKKFTVKASKLSKKAVTVKKAIKVANAKGTVKFTVLKKGTAKKIIKKLKVTKKGNLKLSKGLKKGTYKVAVKVTVSGTKDYNKTEKTLEFKVKVK